MFDKKEKEKEKEKEKIKKYIKILEKYPVEDIKFILKAAEKIRTMETALFELIVVEYYKDANWKFKFKNVEGEKYGIVFLANDKDSKEINLNFYQRGHLIPSMIGHHFVNDPLIRKFLGWTEKQQGEELHQEVDISLIMELHTKLKNGEQIIIEGKNYTCQERSKSED